MMGPLVVGISLFLVASTRLRVEGYPMGPGEAMLAVWLVYELGCLLWTGRSLFSRTLLPIPWFWLLYAALLLAGWLYGIVLGLWRSGSGMHDAIAMFFVAAFCIMYVSRAAEERFSITAGRVYILIGGIVLTGLLLITQHDKEIFGYATWTLNDRFLGLTTNPNQMALGVVCIPFLYFRVRYRDWKDIFLLVACLGAVVSGLASRSDALFVAWAAGVFGYFVTLSVKVLAKPVSSELQLILRLVVYSGAVVGIISLVLVISSEIFQAMQNVYSSEGSQGSVRLSIWANAVEALSQSPWVGFGPGAYSGLTGPFQGKEAHNVVLDLALNSGVVGAVLFMSLIMWALWCTAQSDYPELFGGICALMAYSMFHYTLRQPIFWFWLISLVSLSMPTRPSFGTHRVKRYSF